MLYFPQRYTISPALQPYKDNLILSILCCAAGTKTFLICLLKSNLHFKHSLNCLENPPKQTFCHFRRVNFNLLFGVLPQVILLGFKDSLLRRNRQITFTKKEIFLSTSYHVKGINYSNNGLWSLDMENRSRILNVINCLSRQAVFNLADAIQFP